MSIIEKRKERRKETAEDFTPSELVHEMLDKLPPEVWTNPKKTFLDNSAGNGNFLISIIKRKLDQGHDPIQALSTIYGVELMYDNVEELHHRLYLKVKNLLLTQKLKDKAWKIIKYNNVCHDALTWDYENWKTPYVEKSQALF